MRSCRHPSRFAVEAPRRDPLGVLSFSVSSDSQAAPVAVRILEPQPMPARQRLLLTLPISGDQYGDEVAEIYTAGLHDQYGFIVVSPEQTDHSWWCNHPIDPHRAQERFMLDGLVPWLTERYPAATGRCLLGFSRTGQGALSLLLRNPETFAAAACFDAPLYVTHLDHYFMADAYGTWENYLAHRFHDLVAARARELGRPRVALMGHHMFKRHMRQAQARMTSLGLPVHSLDVAWPAHAWFGGWLPEAVALLDQMDRGSPERPLCQ